MSKKLIDSLNEYVNSDIYPMHMPGHKRNWPVEFIEKFGQLYKIDITETYGMDNLSSPEGIIKAAISDIESIYKSCFSHVLVGGSTLGIHIAVNMIMNDNIYDEDKLGIKCNENNSVIVADNCHYMVYNSLKLLGINPIKLKVKKNGYGIDGGIDLKELSYNLDKYKPRALIITSPNYSGVVCDVKNISELSKKHNTILIVDEAHGAHLRFLSEELKDKNYPVSALYLGADIVIQSLHKTLPAFNQLALIHLANCNIRKEYALGVINMLQTSSPSYIFISNAQMCAEYCIKPEAKNKYKKLISFIEDIKRLELKNLHIYNPTYKNLIDMNAKSFDITKILICIKENIDKKFTGNHLKALFLREHDIELEAACERYCIALTSVCDTENGFVRLKNAIIDIDNKLNNIDSVLCDKIIDDLQLVNNEKKLELLKSRINKAFVGSVYVYPPAIPILSSGDILSEDKYKKLEEYSNNGFNLLIQDI